MARRMALSKMVQQSAVASRSVTGLATSFNDAHQINAPVLERYGTSYQVYDNFPTTVWCLCVQDADTLVDPSVTSEPDIILLPPSWSMAMVLSVAQANAANSALAQTDIGVAVSPGSTVKSLIAAILTFLNHSPGAEEWIFL